MVTRGFIFYIPFIFLVNACGNNTEQDINLAGYQDQLEQFAMTKNVENICNAASIIGNRQRAFSYSKKERKDLFIQHIKSGLDETQRQGLSGKETACTTTLWNDLYVLQTAIINQSRDMVKCLDSQRINGNYISSAYDNCAKTYNYTP